MSTWIHHACITILLVVFVPACYPPSGYEPRQVCFADQCVHVELARTREERARGLQHRQSLGNDRGMLFVFPKSHRQGFWMKDTFISLDIVWMGRDKRIVYISPNVLPCTTEQCPVYTPERDAVYVLEVNAGVTTEMGLKVGDQAVFR